MFQVVEDKYELLLNRNGIKTKFNYDPVYGMMYRRQLPEYMQYLAPKGKKIWRKKDNKILLIGGGQSNIRQWFKKIGVKIEISNVDFYTNYKSTVSHLHYKEDFYDWHIEPNHYDQEWALWSLPSYALSRKELEIFYIKSAIGLSAGGVLRVFPINRSPGLGGQASDDYSKDQRKADTIELLKQFKELGFTIEYYNPHDMEDVVDKLKRSRRPTDKTILALFIKQVSKRRQRYIKRELADYQKKELNKAPIAVNVIAPSKASVKYAANQKLNALLEQKVSQV